MPRGDAPDDSERPVPGEVDLCERVDDLSDDVVPREPVEAEHDEVESRRGELVGVEPVERELLVVRRVGRLAYDARLCLVASLWQQLQLHVRVGRAHDRVLRRQRACANDRDDQRGFRLVVRDGELQRSEVVGVAVFVAVLIVGVYVLVVTYFVFKVILRLEVTRSVAAADVGVFHWCFR